MPGRARAVRMGAGESGHGRRGDGRRIGAVRGKREAYRVAVTSAVGLRVTAVAEPAISITEKEVAGGGVRVTVSQIGTVATSSEAVINWGNQI